MRAQSVIIKGALLNEGQLVEVGNVLLLDSLGTFLGGEFVFDGSYEIVAPGPGTYRLTFTVIGMVDGGFDLILPEGEETFTAHDFYLDSDAVELVTAEVTARRKPLFEKEAGKLIVNVGDNPMTFGANVHELLGRIPSVQTTGEGGVSVFGKGATIVLLDNRRVPAGELASLPAEDIERIEVISNPSARYEATGRAVINIITKKNRREGTYLSLRSSQRHGEYLRTFNVAQLSYRNPKLNVAGAYYFHPHQLLHEDRYERQRGNVRLSQEVNELLDRHRKHTYRLNVDYLLTPESGIGIQYRGNTIGERITQRNLNEIIGLADLSGIDNTTLSRASRGRNGLVLNYWKDYGDNGRKLRFTVDATRYVNQATSDFAEVFTTPLGGERAVDRTSFTEGRIDLATTQLDYDLPTSSQGGVLTLGLRATAIDSRSSLTFEEMVNEQMVAVEDLSNEYEYQEQISAAFADWNDEFGKWSLAAGLRMEHASNAGVSRGGNTNLRREYWNLFPSIGVGYQVSPNLKTSLNYGKRIDRPSYQDLDPYLLYIDSLSYFQGNPELVPALTHNLDADLTYMEYANITVGFQHTTNAILQYVEPIAGSEGGARLSMRNLDRVRTFSLGTTLPYQTKKWTTANSFGVRWNEVTLTENGRQRTFNKPMWYAAFYNAYKIGKQTTLDATVQYNSSGRNGIFRFDPNLQTNVSVSRRMLDDKLTLTLTANDLFGTDRVRTDLDVAGLSVGATQYFDVRWIQLAARYSIGVQKRSVVQQVGSEAVNRIKR